MEGMFGELSYAGESSVITERVNRVKKVKERRYSLFSDVQRADNIEVRLPGDVGEKKYEFEDPVELINPKIIAEGYVIGGKGYTNYILLADDMKKYKRRKRGKRYEIASRNYDRR